MSTITTTTLTEAKNDGFERAVTVPERLAHPFAALFVCLVGTASCLAPGAAEQGEIELAVELMRDKSATAAGATIEIDEGHISIGKVALWGGAGNSWPTTDASEDAGDPHEHDEEGEDHEDEDGSHEDEGENHEDGEDHDSHDLDESGSGEADDSDGDAEHDDEHDESDDEDSGDEGEAKGDHEGEGASLIGQVDEGCDEHRTTSIAGSAGRRVGSMLRPRWNFRMGEGHDHGGGTESETPEGEVLFHADELVFRLDACHLGLLHTEANAGHYRWMGVKIAKTRAGAGKRFSVRIGGIATRGDERRSFEVELEDDGDSPIILPIDVELAAGAHADIAISLDYHRLFQGVDLFAATSNDDDHVLLSHDSNEAFARTISNNLEYSLSASTAAH